MTVASENSQSTSRVKYTVCVPSSAVNFISPLFGKFWKKCWSNEYVGTPPSYLSIDICCSRPTSAANLPAAAAAVDRRDRRTDGHSTVIYRLPHIMRTAYKADKWLRSRVTFSGSSEVSGKLQDTVKGLGRLCEILSSLRHCRPVGVKGLKGSSIHWSLCIIDQEEEKRRPRGRQTDL